MSKKPLTMKDILQKIEWVQIETKREGFYVPDDKIAVGFYKSKSELTSANEIRIRFGGDVIKRLKWKQGDKLVPYHHPDDLMTMMICKTENGSGYTLGKENLSVKYLRLHFKWHKSVPIQPRHMELVEFLMPKDQYLVFRIEESKAPA